MPRAFLINPPGSKVFLRDYYCSKVSKGSYVHHPTDLVYLSGSLRTASYEPVLIDAILEKLSFTQTLNRLASYRPESKDAMIVLTGSCSLDEDRFFIKELAGLFPVRILASGDLFLDKSTDWLDYFSGLSCALLDFTNFDAVNFLRNRYHLLENVIYRDAEGKKKLVWHGRKYGELRLPAPAWEIFPQKYSYPFIQNLPFATVLTAYGCPFNCSYCSTGTLGYKLRPPGDVEKELNLLHSLGYRELYINDQTFTADLTHARKIINLLYEMKKKGKGFTWSCFTRVDRVDRATLLSMKEAGCHTVMFGVESASTDLIRKEGRNIPHSTIIRTFSLARRTGLKTVATFMLGLPGESVEEMESTIRYAILLEPDFVSFNTTVPRHGTVLRTRLEKEGILTSKTEPMDQSGIRIVSPARNLKELQEITRKAYSRFYLRPAYLAGRLLSIHSLHEAKTLFCEGMSLASRLFFPESSR